MSKHRRGRSEKQWEDYDRRLIQTRLNLGLDLLPWMNRWLKKRKLKIEEIEVKRKGRRKSRRIVLE